MSTAFLQFSDPYSWLIRGFVEAKWQDLTLESYQVLPQQSGAGFDLRHLIQTGGRYGIRISVMAIDEHGDWYSEDQVYAFDVVFGLDNIGQPSFLVSSKDTGFSEFFTFSQHNPLMAAEQLIERVQDRHVPQFISEKRRGRTVSSHDINAMYTTRPLPVDNGLLQFLYQRTQNGLTFNTAISEGLWYPQQNRGLFSQSGQAPQQSLPPQQSFPPQQNTHRQAQQTQEQIPQQPMHQQPIIQSGIISGGGMGAIISEGNVVGDERGQVIAQLQSPARALLISAYVGIAFGIAEFVNSVLIFMKINSGSMVIPDKGHYFLLFGLHLTISLYCIFGGIVSHFLNKEYRQIGNNIKAICVIIFPATIPVCCISGIPISIWAFWIWNKRDVKSLRST